MAGAPGRNDAFVHATVVETESAVYAGRLERDVLAGGNCAFTRTTLTSSGGWDERLGAGSRYPAAEDNDLGHRLLEAGYRIVYVPDAVLVHRAWRPRSEYVRLRWRYGLGKGAFYAKHLSLRDPHILRRLGRDLRRRFVHVPRNLESSPRQVLGDMTYTVGVLTAIGAWLVTERAPRR
jgi:GT2 family glycosyltransferase